MDSTAAKDGVVISMHKVIARKYPKNILTMRNENLNPEDRVYTCSEDLTEDLIEDLTNLTEQAVYTIFRRTGWKSFLKKYAGCRWVSRKLFTHHADPTARAGGAK
jgi:hypothetical protein